MECQRENVESKRNKERQRQRTSKRDIAIMEIISVPVELVKPILKNYEQKKTGKSTRKCLQEKSEKQTGKTR